MSREIMEQALDALENHSGNYKLSKTESAKHNAAVEALRQAIERQELADAFAEDFPNTWGKKKHTSLPQQKNAINQALAYLQTGNSLDVPKAISILKETQK